MDVFQSQQQVRNFDNIKKSNFPCRMSNAGVEDKSRERGSAAPISHSTPQDTIFRVVFWGLDAKKGDARNCFGTIADLCLSFMIVLVCKTYQQCFSVALPRLTARLVRKTTHLGISNSMFSIIVKSKTDFFFSKRKRRVTRRATSITFGGCATQ